MIALPSEVICEGILPHLSIRDLQTLDTAYTNKLHRLQLRKLWRNFKYNSCDCVLYCVDDVQWLLDVGVTIIGINVDYKFLALALIVTRMPRLKQLKFSGIARTSPNEFVAQLGRSCPHLEVLHLLHASFDSKSLISLAQTCRNLRSLRLQSCEVTDAVIQTLCKNCLKIVDLGLHYSEKVSDDSLLTIANTYPHLQSVNIRDCGFTDDAVVYFADRCRELRSVAISGDNITSRGLTALCAANPNLTELDITDYNYYNPISDDDFTHIIKGCPHLQQLNITHSEFSDASMIAVAEHCPQLRSLNISECRHISDASLIALAQRCHELKLINIVENKIVTDVGIAALAAGCPLLQEFHAFRTNVAVDGIMALANNCRDLRTLYASNCLIGTNEMAAIVQNCPLISELHLSGCNVSDSTLDVIAQHCRNLVHLSINSASSITPCHLLSLVKSCRELCRLVVGYIDGDVVAALKKINSRLVIICRGVQFLV